MRSVCYFRLILISGSRDLSPLNARVTGPCTSYTVGKLLMVRSETDVEGQRLS